MRNSHAPRPKLSARNVWTTCMMPPTTSSHPTRVVTASPATNGSRTANVPSTMKAIAVTMNQVPTLWTTGIGSWKVSTRFGAVIAASLHSRTEGARRLPSRDVVIDPTVVWGFGGIVRVQGFRLRQGYGGPRSFSGGWSGLDGRLKGLHYVRC